MFYTLGELLSDLTDRVDLSANTTTVAKWQKQAMKEMIDSCWERITDVTSIDLTVDGVLSRWELPGDNIAVLPPEYQTAPDGLASPPTYLAFSDVAWRQHAPDDLIIEQGVNRLGQPAVAGTVVGVGMGLCTIAATAPPVQVRVGGVLVSTKVRVWYQRRVPQPDFNTPTDLVRAPMQFARIATLGYYLGILCDNQAGGDLRLWRKRAEEYLQQASMLYNQAVPIVSLTKMKADDWLMTGVAS